jgi:alpha-1,4-galacturonosyltransferase
VLSDGQNYYAMKLWFKMNKYGEAAVQVLNVEHLEMDSLKDNQLQLSLPEEFRVSFRNNDNPSMGQFRTEYVSIFSHSHYLLPDIFRKLKKVIVLDDDVVIQQDLSALWNLDMGDKVNGAVQFCSVRLGQLKSYLGEKGYSHNSCAWMSGLNIINLVRWREFGITQTYKRLIKEVSSKNPLICITIFLENTIIGNHIAVLKVIVLNIGRRVKLGLAQCIGLNNPTRLA